MLNIIGKRNVYFLISLLVIIPGIISLFVFGLKLSIDFTGGTRMSLLFPEKVNERTIDQVESAFEKEGTDIVSMQPSDNRLILRTKPIDEKKNAQIVESIKVSAGKLTQEEFATIGPTIGKETTLNAFYTILLASTLIVLYIAFSFRSVPKPTSSWKFGVVTIAALVHDVLLVVGVFSILGHFLQVEVDGLFVTAILTVIGFSVHDTIVVFDRIRENLRRYVGVPFAEVVNNSIVETIVRSLNTSLTSILVLLTLFLFGGESIRWFVGALLIGMISGTYSSIFNAAPILVVWQEWEEKKRNKK